jgi:hypothetical protein
MSFFKKSNAKSHRSVSQDIGQHSLSPMGRPEEARSSKTEAGLTRRNAQPFVEDFGLEHSFSRVLMTHMALPASSDFRVPGRPKHSCAYDKSWPNCVYLG